MTEIQANWLIVIAVLSAGFACWGVWLSRRTAKQRATLDFINEYNNEPRVSSAFRVIRKKQSIFSNDDDRDDFLFLMCKFEILAIGLKNAIYDKKMVKDAFGRDLNKIYNESKPLIEHIRTNESDSDAFTAFEQLAKSIKTTVSY